MTTADVARETRDLAAFRRFVREKRGGEHRYLLLLGLKSLDTSELLEKVETGFRYRTIEHFQRNVDLQAEELARLLQIKRRTLARRRKTGRLTSEESDRLLRASRVFGSALSLFGGDAPAARAWFSSQAVALGDRTPRDVSSTEIGAREVEHLIGRLEHGIFS